MGFMTTKPTLSERANSLGWLASTPPEYPFRFAVTGVTEAQAAENFADAVRRWEAIPDDGAEVISPSLMAGN